MKDYQMQSFLAKIKDDRIIEGDNEKSTIAFRRKYQ
jgi:hypothetical protein